MGMFRSDLEVGEAYNKLMVVIVEFLSNYVYMHMYRVGFGSRTPYVDYLALLYCLRT